MTWILIEAFLMSAAAGIAGGIYRNVLAYEPILNWWFRFGNRFEKKFFFPAIWGCVKCISGQFGLWSYLLLVIVPGPWAWGYAWGLIVTICGAIAVGELMGRVFK